MYLRKSAADLRKRDDNMDTGTLEKITAFQKFELSRRCTRLRRTRDSCMFWSRTQQTR